MARLAHEIRNPLSSLDVHVQLLEEDVAALPVKTPAELTSRFEIIRGELHRLETIVGNFLKLARPSALELETLELPALGTYVCDLLRPEAAARGIRVDLMVHPDIPPIEADRVRLVQALLNMLINALQAVKGNGLVNVELSRVERGVMVRVSDNGPGIPDEKLASIFDPYFTTKEEGSGLGLWIAQQIVTAHGGTLLAQNKQPSGAVFIMTLPLKAASQKSQ